MDSLDFLFRERTYINDHSARDTLLKGSERLDNKQKSGDNEVDETIFLNVMIVHRQSNYCSPGELNANHQII